jgi:phage repressor protein C with HTH and peptisase S24 domain
LKGFKGRDGVGHIATYSGSYSYVNCKNNIAPYPVSYRAIQVGIGERISDRLIELGISQAELARRVGVAQPTINNLIHRNKVGTKHLHRIARELQTTPAYLSGETDDPSEGALPVPTPETIAEQLGMTLIPEIDLAFALGGGSFVDGYVATTMVPYRTDWLHRFTRGEPADVFLTRGDGDSMMPTILDDDDVIVNRSDRVISKQDRIWALGYGDLVSIKRVRRMADGKFHLVSDNPNVTPIIAYEDELRIIGRVIWVGRRM